MHNVSFIFSCSLVSQGGKRSDGRNPFEIRLINSQCGLLPRAHGSALFTRGETQVHYWSFIVKKNQVGDQLVGCIQLCIPPLHGGHL